MFTAAAQPEAVLKLFFDGQLKRHRVPLQNGKPSIGFKDLRRIASKIFAPGLKFSKKKFHFQYEDDEKEVVTISHDAELAEAFRVAREEGRKSLHIDIVRKTPVSQRNDKVDAKICASGADEDRKDEETSDPDVEGNDDEDDNSEENSGGKNLVVNVAEGGNAQVKLVQEEKSSSENITSHASARLRVEARKGGRRPPPPAYESVASSSPKKGGRKSFFDRHSKASKESAKKGNKAFLSTIKRVLEEPSHQAESKREAANPTAATSKPSKPVPLSTISGGAKLFLDGTVEFSFDGEAQTIPSEILPGVIASCSHSCNAFTSVGAQNLAVSSGKWYYELTLLTSGCMQVGWAALPFQGAADAGEGVGDDKLSWAYDGFRQLRWHHGTKEVWGPKWRAGNTICCALDADRGIIRFALDGKWGTFQKSTAFFQAKHDDGLLPAVSFSRGERCRFNFGAPGTPLKFGPPDASYLPIWEAYGTTQNIAPAAGVCPPFSQTQPGDMAREQEAQQEENAGDTALTEAQDALTALILDESVRKAISKVLSAPELAEAIQSMLAAAVTGSHRDIMRCFRGHVPKLVPLGIKLIAESPELIPVGMHILTILAELGVLPRGGRWRRGNSWAKCSEGFRPKHHHSRANEDKNWRRHHHKGGRRHKQNPRHQHGRRIRRWLGNIVEQAVSAAQVYATQAASAAAAPFSSAPSDTSHSAAATCGTGNAAQVEKLRIQQAVEESVKSASESEEADLQMAVQLSIEEMQAQAQAQESEATNNKKSANPVPPPQQEQRVAEQPRPRARFIKDNVQRKGALQPGEAFQHSWRLKNNGNYPWPQDVTAQCTGGDPLVGADAQVQLPFSPVQAGDAVDIQVNLVAPETPGRYISYWRLFSDGQKFGDRIWVDVSVEEVQRKTQEQDDEQAPDEPPITSDDKEPGVDADWVAVGEIMRNSLSSQQNGEVQPVSAEENLAAVGRDGEAPKTNVEAETQEPTAPAAAAANKELDPAVQALIKMGFDAQQAETALVAAKGNVPEAVVYLLGASR